LDDQQKPALAALLFDETSLASSDMSPTRAAASEPL
jgi:hypothetical protein